MLELTREEVVARLRAACAASSQTAWARAHGVSGQYVSDVLHGRRSPGAPILAGLGVVRVERYVAGARS